jgi:hypothetical protein
MGLAEKHSIGRMEDQELAVGVAREMGKTVQCEVGEDPF